MYLSWGGFNKKGPAGSKLAKNINVYSFSLRPEGIINLVEHVIFQEYRYCEISNWCQSIFWDDNIYAINYNILRIMSGMGGRLFKLNLNSILTC